ncbi:MAG: hypothetical protein M3Y87_24295, partial [Myxococcota bacterium]|nr:hypothetical protein [Myxococcota bacterium]
MSRNFHNVHVRTDDEAPVVDAIARWLAAKGFEPVKREADADRTVRISRPLRGWVTILDDGHEIQALARVATEATGGSAIEAYCEASAIVWLALHRAGALVGGWGHEVEAPTDELTGHESGLERQEVMQEPTRSDVDALGVPGLDAGALSEAWRDAIREIFPESAIAVAARSLGLDVPRVFEDRGFRGATLRVRRTTSRWAPAFVEGPMRFEVYASPPDALFVDRDVAMQISVRSIGGAGRVLEVRFGEQDLLSLERLTLRDGRSFPIENGAAQVDVAIAASLTETPDLGLMTRREADRAQELSAAASTYLMLHARTLRSGRGTLSITVNGQPATCELAAFAQPYRPLRTEPRYATPEHDRKFLGMHIRALRFATLCFAGSLADAWAWSRPFVAEVDESGTGLWHLVVGSKVVAQDRARALSKLDALARQDAPSPWVTLHAPGATFGNVGVPPGCVYEGEEPVLALTLVDDATCEATRAPMVATLDEAMRSGVAISALLASWDRSPRHDATLWETLTMPFSDALSFRSWHAERLRALDHEGVWLGPTHLARVRLDALPPYAEVTRLHADDGALVAARIGLPPELPRAALRALEEVLDPILPSPAATDAWNAAH